MGRVLEFPTILFSAGNSKAGCRGGRGEGQGPGERDGGQGTWGLTLTCKVQLPHKLGCFLKDDIHINTQTQLHAHMRRKLCIPEGWDLGLPAPKELQGRSWPSLCLGSSPQPPGAGRGGAGESSGEGCLFSEVLSTSTQMTGNQIHRSWVLHACAARHACGQPVCWHEGPVSPLQGSGEGGCRQRRVKGPAETSSPPPHGVLASGRGEGPPLSLGLHGRVRPGF